MSENDNLQGLNCPNCQGMVPIPEGVTIIICPYCDFRSYVKGETGISRYQVQLRVSRENAEKAYKKFLSGKMAVARDAASKSRLTEVFVAYLPFWAKWSRVLGWVFGQKKVGSGDDARWENREVKIVSEMDWNGAACDVGEFGVEYIDLNRNALEPFDPDKLHSVGMVFEPVGSMTDARKMADAEFDLKVSMKANLNRVSQTFVRYVKERMGLVYHPLWIMRYLYKNRAYQVVVDGSTGELLYGKAPGSTMYRAIVLVAGMALGAFIAIDGSAMALFGTFTISDGDGLGLIVVAGIAFVGGLGMMAGAYRAFRYGEMHEHRQKPRKMGKNMIAVFNQFKEFTS